MDASSDVRGGENASLSKKTTYIGERCEPTDDRVSITRL